MFKSIKKVLNTLLGKKEMPEIRIIHDNYGLHMHGIAIAGAMVFTDGSKHIVVDDYFYQLDDISQRAVLAHERGHIILGHLDNLGTDNMADRHKHMAQGTVQPVELEADAYGASIVGVPDMVHMLCELMKLPIITPHAHGEIKNRIAALLKDY